MAEVFFLGAGEPLMSVPCLGWLGSSSAEYCTGMWSDSRADSALIPVFNKIFIDFDNSYKLREKFIILGMTR